MSDGSFRNEEKDIPEKRKSLSSLPVTFSSNIMEQIRSPRKSLSRAHSLYGVVPSECFGPNGFIKKCDEKKLVTLQDPSSLKLDWLKPVQNILVLNKISDSSILTKFCILSTWLVQEKKVNVYVETWVLEKKLELSDDVAQSLRDFPEGDSEVAENIDLVICLGGDGTLLHASTIFQESMPPVVAFSMGSLGFLTPFPFNDFRLSITDALNGGVRVVQRTRIKCVLCKKDSPCQIVPWVNAITSTTGGASCVTVLNEVVIDRGPSPYLSQIDVFVDNLLITTVQGDGLIISTPTGSTAYAAAAGASMLHASLPAIVLAPICPHSLSFRPIVIPAGVEIKVVVSPGARQPAWVSCDGKFRQALSIGDSLRITSSPYPSLTVAQKDGMSDWFRALGDCLHWNERRRQNSMES